jgi:hypothetical protein
VDSSKARDLASELLADALPRRWNHVLGVAAKATALAATLPEEDRAVLVDAAWLHDVGYSPVVVDTGLHALDGARWLRHQGVESRTAALVAYHTCATYEAAERGLAEQLATEFEAEESLTADLLWYVDMTTGPDGESVGVQERLAEIRQRYGPEDVVSRFWRRAEPAILDVVSRVEHRLVEANGSTDVGLNPIFEPVADPQHHRRMDG